MDRHPLLLCLISTSAVSRFGYPSATILFIDQLDEAIRKAVTTVPSTRKEPRN